MAAFAILGRFGDILAANPSLCRSGINAAIKAQRCVPARLVDPKVKNRSRTFNQKANLMAQKAQYSRVASANDRGLITERSDFLHHRKGDSRFRQQFENIGNHRRSLLLIGVN